MMKRILAIYILIVPLLVFAQTQQGYVKTKGRLANNGTVIAGTRLPGATVTVRGGNAVVSGNSGKFSLSISANNYYLQNVQKQGYVLTDPDVLAKQYAYSKNPLVLVLEDKEQQKADMRAIERKISSNLYSQLQKRSDELEALKEKNQITEEKYRELLQKLNHDQDENEKLISEMADRYSKMDFDEVDEFNRRISCLILEGQLTEADSLLNTKGDINSRATSLRQHQEANAQAEKKLEKSKAMAQKELEDLAQDCYRKHEIFKMQHKNDSAACYLEFRAELDTTNMQWQNEAGKFLDEYLANYPKALTYYQRVLRQSIKQEGEGCLWTATAYNNVGFIYSRQGDYIKAMDYFGKSLKIKEEIFETEHPAIATSFNNIGDIYTSQRNYSKALESYKKALFIREKVFGKEHPDVANSFNNIGFIYSRQEDYTKALDYYCNALAIQEKCYGAEHPDVANSYNNIGYIYSCQGDYPMALQYYQKALSIQQELFGAEHPAIAISYSNMGTVFCKQSDYAKALTCFEKAHGIQEKILGAEHPDIVGTYYSIGSVYNMQKDYTNALDYYQKALRTDEKTFGKSRLYIYLERIILATRYREALESRQLPSFLLKHAFIVSVSDGDTPAKQQGMSGEYYLLELADWTQGSMTSLFDKNKEMRDKPKNILVMKDDSISQHHFDNAIGVQFGIKDVSMEERQRINKAYENWKRQNRK